MFEKDKMVGELGEVETEICKILKGDYTYSYLTFIIMILPIFL